MGQRNFFLGGGRVGSWSKKSGLCSYRRARVAAQKYGFKVGVVVRAVWRGRKGKG